MPSVCTIHPDRLRRKMLATNISRVTIASTKTERTRARLEECAIELFLKKGYDATSVAEIAAAAGVSEMTFFRYFPTKESVVLDDPYDPYIASAIGAQPRELPAIVRVAHGIRDAWRQLPEPEGDRTRDRIRLLSANPALRAGSWRNNEATELIIAERLIADGTHPLEARVAASACLAAIMAALIEWATSETGTLGSSIELALETVAGQR